MTGRHAIDRKALAGIVTSPAGRGVAAALAFGTIFGAVIPAATADSAEDSKNELKAVSNPHQEDETGAPAAVTAPSDAEWNVEQITFSTERASIGAAFSVEKQNSASTAQEPVAVQGSNSSVAATALSYVGSRYRWGGTTPAGWDCIGFVRWVYAQHGVKIGSTPASVLSVGRKVPYSQVQAGDILYWPGHVAISVGGTKNVGAWNPSMGTAVGPNSWIGTPTVIRVF